MPNNSLKLIMIRRKVNNAIMASQIILTSIKMIKKKNGDKIS